MAPGLLNNAPATLSPSALSDFGDDDDTDELLPVQPRVLSKARRESVDAFEEHERQRLRRLSEMEDVMARQAELSEQEIRRVSDQASAAPDAVGLGHLKRLGGGGGSRRPSKESRDSLVDNKGVAAAVAGIKSSHGVLAGKLESPVSAPSMAVIPESGKRHKWRLCFRVEREGPTEDFSAEMREPQDFFITVTDPPLTTGTRPVPCFFAADLACQVANIIVGRALLEQLPGQSLLNKTLCFAGKDGLLSGLVSAMLGAKVALLCHQRLQQHMQQNARAFMKEALDYTQLKNTVVVMPYGPGRTSGISGLALCEELNRSPWLNMVVLTESEAAGMFSAMRGASEEHWGLANGRDFIFRILRELVPAGAPTSVLLVCNRATGICENWFEDDLEESEIDDVRPELDVPLEWRVRPFCGVHGKFVVLWLQRIDAEGVKTPMGKQQAPLRKYLPPMGASSSRCGCGGHPQRSFLNHSVQNPEWFHNNNRLKEAILAHNRWKLDEATVVLEEARSWAAAATAGLREATPEAYSARGAGGLSSSWVQEASHDAEAALLAQMRATTGGSGGHAGRSANLGDELPALRGNRWRQPGAPVGVRTTDKSKHTSCGSGSQSARCERRPKGPDITQRHECPPHFYSCKRTYYSFTR